MYCIHPPLPPLCAANTRSNDQPLAKRRICSFPSDHLLVKKCNTALVTWAEDSQPNRNRPTVTQHNHRTCTQTGPVLGKVGGGDGAHMGACSKM